MALILHVFLVHAGGEGEGTGAINFQQVVVPVAVNREGVYYPETPIFSFPLSVLVFKANIWVGGNAFEASIHRAP